MAESYNPASKNDWTHRTAYPTKRQAITDVARYIELRCNTRRIHSGLRYRAPQEVHDDFMKRQLAA